jgi:hypothetical protein
VEQIVIRRFWFLAIAAMMFPDITLAASPYVGEQLHGIKALSDQEVSDYLTGKGMGFAKAAELNGYPGPAHVLELADELALSPLQKMRTEQVFERMQLSARALGARLIDEERRLDKLFASKAISPESLGKALSSIAAIQGEIRQTHLQAHLEEAQILSETQAAKYWHLRGYADVNPVPQHKH